jgi:hypothetical protein
LQRDAVIGQGPARLLRPRWASESSTPGCWRRDLELDAGRYDTFLLQMIEQSPRLDDHVGIDGFDGRRVEPRTTVPSFMGSGVCAVCVFRRKAANCSNDSSGP